jgi:hypothetical protein
VRVLLAFAVFLGLAASDIALPGFCLFRALFDFDCPGCGITRSIVALLSFDVARSFALNPAGAVVVLYFATYPSVRVRPYADRLLLATLAAVWSVRVIIPQWL